MSYRSITLKALTVIEQLRSHCRVPGFAEQHVVGRRSITIPQRSLAVEGTILLLQEHM